MTEFPRTEPEPWLDSFVRNLMKENNDRVNRAVLAATLRGEHGVLVTRYPTGRVTAEVCPDVPYGEIWEYPLSSLA